MTQWTAERIPLWVSPAAGEALDSWLEAYGRRLAVTGGQFARFVDPSCGDPRSMVRMLTDAERGALSWHTGLTPAALDAMTFKRFDGVVVTIDPLGRTITRPPAWRHSGAHSRSSLPGRGRRTMAAVLAAAVDVRLPAPPAAAPRSLRRMRAGTSTLDADQRRPLAAEAASAHDGYRTPVPVQS
ncbi:TniQ family protein [Streptomyces sp. Tue6028]|uniref:TniQ family protein n=1 Tax=Streptomyces sp. Tue6028 TaxID=2036037 RepID=UPI003D75C044